MAGEGVVALEPVDMGLIDEDEGFEYKSVSLGDEVDDDFDDGNLDKVILAAHRAGSAASGASAAVPEAGQVQP